LKCYSIHCNHVIESKYDFLNFRSCDLTFGTGSLNNEEDFCWLSSSHGAEGSDDALKSDFKFSYAEMSPLKSISDYKMDSKKNMVGLSNDSDERSSPVDEKNSSQMEVIDDGVPVPLSMFSENESDMKSGIKVDLLPKEKVGYPFILFHYIFSTF